MVSMYSMLAPGRLVIKTSSFSLGRHLSKKSKFENNRTKNGDRDEKKKIEEGNRKIIKASDLLKAFSGVYKGITEPGQDIAVPDTYPSKSTTSQKVVENRLSATEEGNSTTRVPVLQSKVLLKHITEHMSRLPSGPRRGAPFTRFSQKLPPPEDLDFLSFQSDKSSGNLGTEMGQFSNPVFDAVEHLESSLLTLTAPLNQFEEWMQWTVEGKLWKFPIDNEQDWETEANVPFHEHMFLDKHIDKALRKSPPVAAFLDLVCAGLAQNPHFTVEQKREHLRWYAEYFKDKLDSIDASVREELRLTELERKARAIGTPAQK